MRTTCQNAKHKGHKFYLGGPMDGQTAHLIYATPSDYPLFFTTLKVAGRRAMYEADLETYGGTEVIYRFVGMTA